MSKQSISETEKTLRTESQVLDDLLQIKEQIKKDDLLLEQSLELLEGLQVEFNHKKYESERQTLEHKQKVNELYEQYQSYSTQIKDAEQVKGQLQKQALGTISSRQDETVREIEKQIELNGDELTEINSTLKDLPYVDAYFKEFQELAIKKELVELVKDVDGSYQLNGAQQAISSELDEYIKNIDTINFDSGEEILDSYLKNATDKLDKLLNGNSTNTSRNIEELADLFNKITTLAKEHDEKPEEFLGTFINELQDQKDKTESSLLELEEKLKVEQRNLEYLKDLLTKSDIADVSLSEEVENRFASEISKIEEEQKRLIEEIKPSQEIDTNKQLASELHDLAEKLASQKQLVQELEDKSKQNYNRLEQFKEELNRVTKAENKINLQESPAVTEVFASYKNLKNANKAGEPQQNLSVAKPELGSFRSENLELIKALKQMAEELQQREKDLQEARAALIERNNASSKEPEAEGINLGYLERQEEIERLKEGLANLRIQNKKLEEAVRSQQGLYEKQLESLRQEVIGKEKAINELEGEIAEKQKALEAERAESKKALGENAAQLEQGIRELAREKEGSSRAGELQANVEQLEKEKQGLEEQRAKLEQGYKAELEELKTSKAKELSSFNDVLELTKKQHEQELAKTSQELTGLKSTEGELQSKLETMQATLEAGEGNRAALEKEIAELSEQIVKNNKEQEGRLAELRSAKDQLEEAVRSQQELYEKQLGDLTSGKEQAQKELAGLKSTEEKLRKPLEDAQLEIVGLENKQKELQKKQVHIDPSPPKANQVDKPIEPQTNSQQVATNNANQGVDKVAIVSQDGILREFRKLKEKQRDIITKHVKIQGLPTENESFHEFASQNGELIGSKLDADIVKSLSELERAKYKEIHSKYPYSNIQWDKDKQSSISKDGATICKLNNSPKPSDEYKLDGKVIGNYRSLDLPTKVATGPMHVSLSVKDLEGNNVSAKEAVFLSAHYDNHGKLVEMTTSMPIYFTGEDKESPICIKQDGKIYTLPINKGKYEEMQKEIAINKGVNKEQAVDSISFLQSDCKELNEVKNTLKHYANNVGNNNNASRVPPTTKQSIVNNKGTSI